MATAILCYAVYVMHFTICIRSYMRALDSKLDSQDSPFINDTIVTVDWSQIFMTFPDSGLLEKSPPSSSAIGLRESEHGQEEKTTTERWFETF